MTQFILGIKPTYNGLQIDPCISPDIKGFTVCRKFRGSDYVIEVSNPDGRESGVREIYVDGTPLKGNVIPIQESGKTVRIKAVM